MIERNRILTLWKWNKGFLFRKCSATSNLKTSSSKTCLTYFLTHILWALLSNQYKEDYTHKGYSTYLNNQVFLFLSPQNWVFRQWKVNLVNIFKNNYEVKEIIFFNQFYKWDSIIFSILYFITQREKNKRAK